MKLGFHRLNAGRFVCLLLVVVTLLVYLPVSRHSFLLFDDADYVTGNRHVQAGLTWAGVNWAFTTFHAGNWHPLTWLSHMGDVQLFGKGPAGPHLVNLLLHIANTVLLFVFLRRITGALWRSAWVAALFSLHPLHVESVAWVAERKDVLSAFFGLLALLAYARYVSEGYTAATAKRKSDTEYVAPNVNHRASGYYLLCLFCFVFGLMSKPMLVTLPFVLMLLDYWPLRRCANWYSLLEKVPFFLLSAISCVVTFAAQKQGGAVRSLTHYSLFERSENALVSYMRYLGKFLWPTDLAAFYPHPGNWPFGEAVAAMILVGGGCFAVLWFGRKTRFAVVGWLWFLGMLVPTIGLVQVSDQSMADRYTYLPSIGVFVLLAWGMGEVVLRWRWSKAATGLVAGMVVVACTVRTETQLSYWQDNESLFRHALAVTERNFAAHYNLADALLEKGRVEEAIEHFEKTLEIRPDFADAHCNFGNALLQKGRVDDALDQFRKTLEIQPWHSLARCNLGLTLFQNGHVDEAIQQFKQALAIRPEDVMANFNFGNILLHQGQSESAIVHYRKVLKVQPDHAETYNNLGAALLQRGQIDEAVAHFQKALELQPRNASAHNNLADIFLQRGRLAEAIDRFQKVLAIQPANADAHCNLGTALLLKGQADEAATHFKKALEIQPDIAPAHNNLGYILGQKGLGREAVTHLQSALKLQPDNAGTLASLAWVLATCSDDSVRDGARAIELAQQSNQLTGGQDPLILRSLAAAYAEVGQFAEAVTVAQRGSQLAAQSNPALADMLGAQLKHYQANRPFRETSPMSGGVNRNQP